MGTSTKAKNRFFLLFLEKMREEISKKIDEFKNEMFFNMANWNTVTELN